jgi:hypothetical protein
MANLAIIALAAPIVLLMTRDWGAVIPNPLDPLAYARDPLIGRSMPMLLLYMINALSAMLLAFNLLPMFPLDGGRLVHAILWQRSGWSASMRLTVRVGFLAGLALLLYGVVSYAWQAVAVAAFGLLTCYQTERQLAFSDSMLDFESDDYALKASRVRSDFSDTWNDRDSDECHGIMDEPDDPSEQSDIDRILKKIASSGLSSLTNEEQQALQRETERKRRESR